MVFLITITPGQQRLSSNEYVMTEKQPTSKSNRIVFSSHHEQEEDNYQYWLSLTPEQRIANATSLIRKVFADQLKQPGKPNRIIFDPQ